MYKNCRCPDYQSCSYAALSSCHIKCKCVDYCQYQLPNDNRTNLNEEIKYE